MSYQKFSEYHNRRSEQETVSHAMVMCETLARLNVDPKSFVNNVCLPVLLENQFSNDQEFVGLLGHKFCEVAEIYGMGLNENMWKNMLGKLAGLGGDESTMAGMANAGKRRPPSQPDVQQKAQAIATFINDHLSDVMSMLSKRFQQNGDEIGKKVLAGVQKKIGGMMNNLRFVGGDQFSLDSKLQGSPNANANAKQPFETDKINSLAGGNNAMTGSFLKRNVMGNANNPKLIQNLLAHAAGNRGGLPVAPSKAAPAPVAAKAAAPKTLVGSRAQTMPGGGINTSDMQGGGSIGDMMKQFGIGSPQEAPMAGGGGDSRAGIDVNANAAKMAQANREARKRKMGQPSPEETPPSGPKQRSPQQRKADAQDRMLNREVDREKQSKSSQDQIDSGNFQKKGQKKGQKKEQKKEQRKEQQKESVDYNLCESLINMAKRTSDRPCWGV